MCQPAWPCATLSASGCKTASFAMACTLPIYSGKPLNTCLTCVQGASNTALNRSSCFESSLILVESSMNLPASPPTPFPHPSSVDELHVMALRSADARQYDEALTHLDTVLLLEPERDTAAGDRMRILGAYNPARLMLALALHQQSAFVAAASVYREILDSDPDHYDALQLLGALAVQMGLFESALQCLDRAIALRPDYADAHSNRGIALQELGELEAALTSFDYALSLKTDSPQIHNNRGNTLKALRHYGQALASYETALSLSPDYADALSNRGSVLGLLNRPDEALASYDLALRIDPSARTWYNRANLLKDSNALDQALASYDQALALEPDFAPALNNRGLVLQQMGHLEEALASFERALASDAGTDCGRGSRQ
ncbi:tetratricopeptide repeat protein [Candidatus Woesearchaeota archaeon]|nr:tetratricopeptide repeat protein [Candidatus Woesearchaeota archaeon]